MKEKSPHSSVSEKKNHTSRQISSPQESQVTGPATLAVRIYTTSRNAFHLPPLSPPPRDLLGPIERTIRGHIGVVGLPSWPRTTDGLPRPLNDDYRLDDDDDDDDETTNPTS